jgi:serine/threonine protein kinase
MTLQLSANSYLQMLRQSGLLTVSQRRAVEQHVEKHGQLSAAEISEWLVQKDVITRWQSEKLLEARYRGFFLGPYRLLDRIARGGMSSIYSARHSSTHELHALKVLPPARTAKASYLPRFRREAEMTQRLVHPNIVRVFGVYEENDGQNPVHFMAMELLQGRDLFEIVNQSGPQPLSLAVEYVRQAAAGLEYAHRHGLVHRDIKPGNLFLTNDGTIRILDLGLAQDFDSEENLTREFNDRVLGTADYLSPEQAADSHAVDARADIYSLGCTLFFLMTGRPPYIEGTLVQRLVAHQTKSPPPLTDFRSDVPDSLNVLLRHMMAKTRNDRIASAALVAEQLQGILDELKLIEADQENAEPHQTPRDTDDHQAQQVFETRTSQKDVETATASSDDSWPDELWQAIAEAAEKREEADSPIDDGLMAVVTDRTVFSEYLRSVEDRLLEDPDFSSDRRAGELAAFVHELRSQSADAIGLPVAGRTITAKRSTNRDRLTNRDDSVPQVRDADSVPSKDHTSTSPSQFYLIVLILTVLLAAITIAATQL